MDVKLGNILIGLVLIVFAFLCVVLGVQVTLSVLGVGFLVYFLYLARKQKKVFKLDEKEEKPPAVALKAVEGLADEGKLKEALDWLESLPDEKKEEEVKAS